MKYYSTVIALVFVILVSCETRTDNKKQPPPPCEGYTSDGVPCYTVPLKDAVIAMKRYDTLLSQLDILLHDVNALTDTLDSLRGQPRRPHRTLRSSLPLRGFTIRSADLLEALGLDSTGKKKKDMYDYVRVYLGLSRPGHFKLFLTPVEGADLNVSPPIAGTDVPLRRKKIVNGQQVEESFVLDFAMPCPSTCPDDPLYAN